jgi:hypothetical protein
VDKTAHLSVLYSERLTAVEYRPQLLMALSLILMDIFKNKFVLWDAGSLFENNRFWRKE